MIIDFHTHCFPDALAERVIPMLALKANNPNVLDGKVPSLLDSMRQTGIDYSVLLQIATRPSQNHTVNTWAIERTEPGIIPFGSIHPLGEDWRIELDRLTEAGVKGIKFHPEYQQFYVDDTAMLPIYKHLRELDLIVVFHAGTDIGIDPPVHGTPQHFERILDHLPEGRTVLAHMGGWKHWDEVEQTLIGTHLIFDTSFSDAFMPPGQMRQIIEKHGADKILMGSDSPWDSQANAIAAIRKLELDSSSEQAILGGNAARLLDLPTEINPPCK